MIYWTISTDKSSHIWIYIWVKFITFWLKNGVFAFTVESKMRQLTLMNSVIVRGLVIGCGIFLWSLHTSCFAAPPELPAPPSIFEKYFEEMGAAGISTEFKDFVNEMEIKIIGPDDLKRFNFGVRAVEIPDGRSPGRAQADYVYPRKILSIGKTFIGFIPKEKK